jgi:hypothetical protein
LPPIDTPTPTYTATATESPTPTNTSNIVTSFFGLNRIEVHLYLPVASW